MRKVEPEVLSPRARFRALLENQMQEHPDLSTAELADAIAETLPDDDRQLVQDFLASEARMILALEIRARVVQHRQQIFNAINIHDQAAPPVRELSERRQDKLYQRIEAWKEFVPSQNRTRTLLEMTRGELMDSSRGDLQKAVTFGFKSLFKQRLAEGMPDDTTTVGDTYTDEQIIDLTERVKKEIGRGNFRLKVNSVDSLPSPDRISRQGDGRQPKKPGGR